MEDEKCSKKIPKDFADKTTACDELSSLQAKKGWEIYHEKWSSIRQ